MSLWDNFKKNFKSDKIYENSNNRLTNCETKHDDDSYGYSPTINDYKYNYEHVYEYNEHDLEIDLLDIYSSLYTHCTDSVKDIRGIEQIEKKYYNIKNRMGKKGSNDNIKELITSIEADIKKYNSTLKTEANKTQKITNFSYGMAIGLGVGAVCAYLYSKVAMD